MTVGPHHTTGKPWVTCARRRVPTSAGGRWRAPSHLAPNRTKRSPSSTCSDGAPVQHRGKATPQATRDRTRKAAPDVARPPLQSLPSPCHIDNLGPPHGRDAALTLTWHQPLQDLDDERVSTTVRNAHAVHWSHRRPLPRRVPQPPPRPVPRRRSHPPRPCS